MIKRIFLLLIISLTPLCSLAWNATGHRLVSTIAYHHLQPQTKAQVKQMLQHLGNSPTQTGFVRAGLWMDIIKIDNIKLFSQWHYVNLPYAVDNTPVDLPNSQNLQWALDQVRTALASPRLTDQDKAFFLRFLLHLVADAHQPMHCISYFSPQFPHGDKGGNLYQVKWRNTTNLHRLWDQGLGLFAQSPPLSPAAINKMAQAIEKEYPQDDYGQQADDLAISAWIQACYSIAKSFSYTVPVRAKPNSKYMTEGRQIVDQQIALAGYRLANLLNQLFG